MVDAQSILMLQETYTTILVFLPMWYWDKTLAEEDKAKGRVTQWNSVDEMFDTILGE